MADGRLEPPPLDDRTWQDIIDQARSLIPRFTPEWTDHNPSDLGMTLIELFAWIVEGMIYRLNRVPDRNYIEFLNLIGVTLDPATPASVDLTYTLAPTLPPTRVPKGRRAATRQMGDQPPVEFETDRDVTILPTSLTHALRLDTDNKDTDNKDTTKHIYSNVTGALVVAPLGGLEISLTATDSATLALGFDQAVTARIDVDVRIREPAAAGLTVGWLYSTDAAEPYGTDKIAAWDVLADVSDGTAGLTRNGQVRLTLPPTWDNQNPTDWKTVGAATRHDVVDVDRFWIGLRLTNTTTTTRRVVLDRVLTNSVPASNALTIDQPEPLGTSTGEPFQAFTLRNSPLFKTPGSPQPYDHLVVQVREPAAEGWFGPWTPWRWVDEFAEGAGQVYRLDPVLGVIDFGSHSTSSPDGHGSIPPIGSEIQAGSYRYVAGDARGNLPPSTITVPQTLVTGIIGVTNHAAAEGGSNQESVADAKRRGPETLRTRDRAITAQDYEQLTRDATTDVGICRALPPRLFTDYDGQLPADVKVGQPWTFGGLTRATGTVHIIVVPRAETTVRTPQPTPELIREVRDHLTARRIITAAVTVTGPRYLEIQATIYVNVWKQAVDDGSAPDPDRGDPIIWKRDNFEAPLRTYLHPVHGKADGSGWQVGEAVSSAGLFGFLQPASNIGFISKIEITAKPLYTPQDRPPTTKPTGTDWVQLADYELVCSAESHIIKLGKT